MMSQYSTDFTLASKSDIQPGQKGKPIVAPRYKSDVIRCKVILNSKVSYTLDEIKEQMFKKPEKRINNEFKSMISSDPKQIKS